MRIELRCACTALAVFDSNPYIKRGGHPANEKGQVYLVQIEAEKWQEEHKHHATMYAPKARP